MPLPDPVKLQFMPIALVTRAFCRALVAYSQYLAAGTSATEKQSHQASWAQYFLYRQGLNPSPEPLTRQEKLGLIEIIREIEAVRAEFVNNEVNGTPITTTSMDLYQRVTTGTAADGFNYLKKSFGAITVSVKRVGQGLTSSQLERCNTLSEAQAILQAEFIRQEIQDRQAGLDPVYDRVELKPTENMNFDDYMSSWSNMEQGRQSAIYDNVQMPLGGGSSSGSAGSVNQRPASGIYAPLPVDPNLNPDHVMDDFAP